MPEGSNPGWIQWVAYWVFGIAVAAAPVIGAEVAGGAVDDWIPVYIAGALGGLVFELLLSAWQLELPGPGAATASTPPLTPPPNGNPGPAGDGVSEATAVAAAAAREDDPFGRPANYRVDVGFWGRMATGGLGAFAVLLIGSVLADGTESGLAANGSSLDTLGWAVAIGAASPAAWQLLQRLASARFGAVERLYTGQLAATETRLQTAQAGTQATLQQLENATSMTRSTSVALATPMVAVSTDALQEAIHSAGEADPSQFNFDAVWADINAASAGSIEVGLGGGDDSRRMLDQTVGALAVLQAQLEGTHPPS